MKQDVQQIELSADAHERQESWPLLTQNTSTASQAPATDIPETPAPASTSVRRALVIRVKTKRTASVADGSQDRHLRSRTRHILVLMITLVALGVVMTTIVPLASDQNASGSPSGLAALLQSARSGWLTLVGQNEAQPTATSATLPPIAIPHSQLVALAEQDATAAGISSTYFVRQITLESGFNPNAVSPGGAEGIAQFEPGTAAGLGIDPFNPVQALKAAAQMMARYANQYGSYAKALAAYNAGPAVLQNAENSCGSNWLSCMPPETQHYVATITG